MARKIKVFGEPKYLKFLRAPRFKIGYTVMSVLPWDKDYGQGIKAMSPAQKLAVANFAEVAHNTRGLPLRERMQIISAQLKGRDYCQEVYGIPSEQVKMLRRQAKWRPPEILTEMVNRLREEARREGAEYIRRLQEAVERVARTSLLGLAGGT